LRFFAISEEGHDERQITSFWPLVDARTRFVLSIDERSGPVEPRMLSAPDWRISMLRDAEGF